MTLAASRCALFALWGISALWSSAGAQALWLDREDRDVVFVEVYKPHFEGGGQPFAASGMLLGARKVLAGGRLALVTDVPIAHARRPEYTVEATPFVIDTLFGDTLYRYSVFYKPGAPATAIGNPYVGVEFPGNWTHELGIRIQSRDRSGVLGVGSAAELERPAFAEETTTLHYGLVHRPAFGPGRHWRWRFAFLVPIGYSATYVVSYRGMMLLDRQRYRLGAGLAGIANVDPSGRGAFDERTAHQIEAMAEVFLGAWRPALHLRLWLDEGARDAVPFVIGVRCEWRPSSRSTQGPD